jgi:hypothetical protein
MINGKYVLLLVIFALVGVMAFNVHKRSKILGSSKAETVVEITELNFRTKGSTTRITDAYYRFYLPNGDVINGHTEINNPSVKVGFCYSAFYAKDKPDIVEVYFSKPVACEK